MKKATKIIADNSDFIGIMLTAGIMFTIVTLIAVNIITHGIH
jgi:predicted nuclease of predicted toxin-antitoxin system